jgi:uncharacterized membrane protein
VKTSRLEAFSDGVLAIIITIMVLELRAPHTPDLEGIRPLLPVFLSYLQSFLYVGIYWNNHHHLFQAARRLNGATLWANLHLLFWLSLIPFVTSWVGESHFAALPAAAYGIVLLLSSIAFTILSHVLIRHHGKDSTLATAIGKDRKGKLSLALYALAIPLAFVLPAIAYGLYFLVALIWLIPDKRIEGAIVQHVEQ